MTIDMHAHWFPETLADAFRKRTSKPMIHTKEDGKTMSRLFATIR
jgi:hypothetical protein